MKRTIIFTLGICLMLLCGEARSTDLPVWSTDVLVRAEKTDREVRAPDDTIATRMLNGSGDPFSNRSTDVLVRAEKTDREVRSPDDTIASRMLNGPGGPFSDSVKQARKEARQEALDEYKEAVKDQAEEVWQQVKEAAEEVKDQVTGAGRSVKDKALQTVETLKENYKQTKDKAVNWFTENIVENTVGEFAEKQRQNNHDFAVMVAKPWNEYALQMRTLPAAADAALFSSKQNPSGDAPVTVIEVGRRAERGEKTTAPVPDNYYTGAGTDAVAKSVTKQFLAYKFFGTEIRIYYETSLRTTTLGKGKEKNVAKFWEYLSDQGFDDVLMQFYQYKEELQLNDLLYYYLIKGFADQLYIKSKHGENLGFTVFMLNQTGYDARLARLEGEKLNQTVVLLPLYEKAYDIPFVTIGSNDYYLPDIKLSKKEMAAKVYCYPKALATARYPLSLYFNPADFKLPPVYGRFKGYILDERLAEVENLFPAGPYYLYCDAAFGTLVHKTLTYRFKPDMDSLGNGKTAAVMASVLDFVGSNLSVQGKQSAKYGNRMLYPDQMFLKKGNGDIRDKSVLFAQIARRIFGVETLVLMYGNYAVPAVYLGNEDVRGTCFEKAGKVGFEGKTYYLCGVPPKSTEGVEPEVYVW